MKNYLSQTFFYLDLKHVHNYGSIKFQLNPLFFFHNKWPPKVRREKKKKKTKKQNEQKRNWQVHRGSRQGTGCPNVLKSD